MSRTDSAVIDNTEIDAHNGDMSSMRDLDKIALAMPGTEKRLDHGRPEYRVDGKMFCFHRGQRADAIDPLTGQRLDDVLMFRVADEGVKEMWLADERARFFTTDHFNGYNAVLLRIGDLADVARDELHELVSDAWLTRASKKNARAWLDANLPSDA
jgi:hypothetical protein